ncbi:hypothetical protein EB077_12020, partial [bacterium]|nr:hypothetical protein [bacterium]
TTPVNTDSLTRTEERNVYVNINANLGQNRYDISKYSGGTTAFAYSNGALNIQGVYDPLIDTVAAIQTKNFAPNISGSIYGGWIDLSRYKIYNGAEISFGLGSLSQTPNHEVEEGVYFDLSSSYERICLRSASTGLYYLENRVNWYDPLDGSGPSGVVYSFFSNKGIFYFEYIYSGNKVNIYLSFAGQEILVQTIICFNALFVNPRQNIFVRAKAPNPDDSFNIDFNGCSIYNCSNSQVPRLIGCSSTTFQVGSEKYSTGFLNGYLAMAFERVPTGIGYRFLRLKDFQVVSEDNHAFTLMVVINPTIINTSVPPNAISYINPYGSYGLEEPIKFAYNYDGNFEITDYELCVHTSQHIQHSELVSVVNQFLGNEIDGTAQTIAIMILPSTNNMHFRVTANVEEI